MSDRDRSASPAREPKAKKQKASGFKWKDKKPRDDDSTRDARDSGHLERGYRDRSPRRDSYHDRDKERSRRDEEQAKNRSPPQRDPDSNRPSQPSNDDVTTTTSSTESTATRRDPFAGYKPRSTLSTAPATTAPAPAPSTEAKKKKKLKPPPAPTGPVIIVTINDRLGTKAQIPCYASDSVKAFRHMVAAHIGRPPGEILLKRQGERPFKDALTLEDYGVSNGVQLDLELDTGD